MPPTTKATITIQKTLYDQAEALARQLHIPRSRFFAIAVENFIQDYQRQQPHAEEPASAPTASGRREIRQGDIYWIPLGAEAGAGEPGIVHPHVVVQDDVFNHSRIHTVVVCALTSNMRRAKAPGNVLLEAGEANLPRRSVVEGSKVSAVYKKQFGAYIGSLSEARVAQILAGLRFLQAMSEHHERGSEE